MEEQKTTILDLITKERAEKAFTKTCDEIPLKEGKFILVTEEYHTQVARTVCEVFTKDEVVTSSLGFDLCADVGLQIFQDLLKQNISIAILDESNGNIMAVRVLYWKDLAADDEYKLEDEKLKIYAAFTEECDSKDDFAKRFNTTEIIHFMGLVVTREYRKRGLATKIMEFAIQFLRNLDIDRPLIVKGEATSNFSKKVYEKFDFELVSEGVYENFRYNGEVAIKETGEHKSMNVYGKRLS